MPDPTERARDIVLRAIDAYNAAEPIAIPRDVDTVLLGPGGVVDSLGLVRLVLTVERQIERDAGTFVSLTDEKAMSQRNSPFRSVGALVEYVASCLGGRP